MTAPTCQKCNKNPASRLALQNRWLTTWDDKKGDFLLTCDSCSGQGSGVQKDVFRPGAGGKGVKRPNYSRRTFYEKALDCAETENSSKKDGLLNFT